MTCKQRFSALLLLAVPFVCANCRGDVGAKQIVRFDEPYDGSQELLNNKGAVLLRYVDRADRMQVVAVHADPVANQWVMSSRLVDFPYWPPRAEPVVDDILVTTNTSGTLASRITDGSVVWVKPEPIRLLARDENWIICTVRTGRRDEAPFELAGIEALTGRVVWQRDLARPGLDPLTVGVEAAMDKANDYVAMLTSSGDQLSVRKLSDGTPVATRELGGHRSDHVLGAHGLLICFGDDQIGAFRSSTLEMAWAANIVTSDNSEDMTRFGNLHSWGARVVNENLYVVETGSKSVMCIDVATGKTRWRQPFSGALDGSMFAVSKRYVVVGRFISKLSQADYAPPGMEFRSLEMELTWLDMADGSVDQVWRTKEGVYSTIGRMLATDDECVYIITRSGVQAIGWPPEGR